MVGAAVVVDIVNNIGVDPHHLDGPMLCDVPDAVVEHMEDVVGVPGRGLYPLRKEGEQLVDSSTRENEEGDSGDRVYRSVWGGPS